MTFAEAATLILLLASAAFFGGATLGLLRFPDTHSRIHAITKADNLGLGLLVAALAFQAGSLTEIAKLILIWLITMFAGSCAGYLTALQALRRREDPEREP